MEHVWYAHVAMCFVSCWSCDNNEANKPFLHNTQRSGSTVSDVTRFYDVIRRHVSHETQYCASSRDHTPNIKLYFRWNCLLANKRTMTSCGKTWWFYDRFGQLYVHPVAFISASKRWVCSVLKEQLETETDFSAKLESKYIHCRISSPHVNWQEKVYKISDGLLQRLCNK